MAVATQPQHASIRNGKPGVPSDFIWRLSVEQYHQMIEAGILDEDDPVELLEGWLVFKMPKKPAHSGTTRLTRRALQRVLPKGWSVDSQEPVTTEDSEPEPDVAVLRGNESRYVGRHPGPRDVAMIVEVSDSTLIRDRTWKKRLYAAARIPVYWIINLIDRQVEVFTSPAGTGSRADYRRRKIYERSDAVPVIIAGREVGRIPVRDLLP